MPFNGIKLPTVTPGVGGNPQESALISQRNNAAQLSALQKVGGGTGSIVVPQMTMAYGGQNGTQNPNNQIAGLSDTAAKQNAQGVYDKAALKQNGGNAKKATMTKKKKKRRTRFFFPFSFHKKKQQRRTRRTRRKKNK